MFRAGGGGYALWVNADWPSFLAKWQEWSNQGLRLTDLELQTVNGQTRYSGVYVSGTGGHALWADTDWARFQAKWKELSGQGLRLVDFAARPTGIEVAASQIAGSATAQEPGAGMGFSQLGGVSVAAGPVEDTTSGAGYGDLVVGASLATSGAPGDAAGFGEAVLGTAPAATEDAAGFGEAVLGAPAGTPQESASSAGFGEAVLEPSRSVTRYGNGAQELAHGGIGNART